MKSLALACACASVWLASTLPALAQAFPDRPVKIIVPYGVGTLTDTVARSASQRLSVLWKQGVVVESVTGAGGVIGTKAIAQWRPPARRTQWCRS